MVGYISEAVATALKTWKPLKDLNIFPVRSTDGGSVVVNTAVPAIVVHILGDEGEGNTYIGGGIRQYFELSLYAILPINNYTFTPDNKSQANMLDSSDEVIRCMELTKALDYVKQNHDLNMQFDRMETDTTYGTKGSISVTIDVHKIVYKCDVEFDLKIDETEAYAFLERVEIEYKNKLNKEN